MGKPKYHTPPISEIKTTSLGAEDRPDKFNDMVGDDGLIHMRLESDVVIDRLARDIYTSPTAGLREIYNNEARQCRTAQAKHKQSPAPTIHIDVDASKRSLSILGTDSMGMSMDTFRNVYTVVGRSGNLSGDESGQFGFGRLATRLLSDVVIVQTYSRETGEQFAFISKDGRAFEAINMPALESFGTKISMTVKDDVSLYEIVKYAHEMARFVKIDTVLCLQNDVVEDSESTNPLTYEQGIYQIGNVSERDYLTEQLCIKADDCVDWIEIDTPEYYFLGIVRDNYRAHYDDMPRQHNLIGIPINMDPLETGGCDGYVLNIKDERRYMPTASRDNLTEQAESEIQEKVQDQICKFIGSIKINSIEDYLDCKYKVIARNCESFDCDGMHKGTKTFASLSKLYMDSYTIDAEKNATRRHLRVFETMDSSDANPAKNNMYCLAVVGAKMNAIWDINPDAKIVFLSHRNSEWRGSFEMFGIRNITDVLKEHNIKVERQKKQQQIREVVTYDMSYGYRRKINVNDLTQTHIAIPKGEYMREYLNCLNTNGINGYSIFKEKPGVSGGIPLDEFVSKVKNTEYSDGRGAVITGKKILETEGICMLVNDSNKYSKTLTLDICKNSIESAYVLVRGTKDTLDPLRAAMILLFRGDNYNDADDDKIIGRAMSASLKIKYDGLWAENYENLRDTLSKISRHHAREIYVRSYQRLFATRPNRSHGYYSRYREEPVPLYSTTNKNALSTLEAVFVAMSQDAKTKKITAQAVLQQCMDAAKDSPREKHGVLSEICTAALDYTFGENVSGPSKDSMIMETALYTLKIHGYTARIHTIKDNPSENTYIKISQGETSEQFCFDTREWNKMFCVDSIHICLQNTTVYGSAGETCIIAEVEI